MTLKFPLNENDFFQYHLFFASKNKEMKNKRLKTRLMLAVTILSLAFIFFIDKNQFLGYYFLAMGLLILLFYQYYLRWYYKKYYRKFVIKTYKARFGETMTVIFNEDSIELSNKSISSKADISEFEEVFETMQHFFVKLRTGSVLIIPKTEVDVDDTRVGLTMLADNLKVEFHKDLDWSWK